jgi:hypothetical protein
VSRQRDGALSIKWIPAGAGFCRKHSRSLENRSRCGGRRERGGGSVVGDGCGGIAEKAILALNRATGSALSIRHFGKTEPELIDPGNFV